MSQSHIQEQIELIARHEQEFLEQRTQAERVIDGIAGFVGSLPFVSVHLCVFALWIADQLAAARAALRSEAVWLAADGGGDGGDPGVELHPDAAGAAGPAFR